ncbi:MAG TPA: LysR substrate-binding domain-containing protein [Thauera sp.]|uniref:LysR substrate-binding domain-containing protein n=1 Tax=Thauera sp. TaxID=1905334 RepID=UPI002CBC2930|nr:LysR substrate-binding domain-containing protein [Thauera sp.]HRP24899.1 LysR substrate-binding domain-containing protein [Thauera sp.]HRP66754.1 LysR substrate-binding domain-containing protein [Thauera sp.]
MKDHQLRALVHVAESSSIRAAARAMNLSQSALTKALRELEEDVGAPLLTRSYKGIEFTAAGMVLLTRARLALSILDKAVEEVRLLHGGAGSRVVIAVTPMAGALVLPRVLREYEQLQPEVEVHLTEGLLTQVLPDLIEGRLDFAIAVADPADLPYEIDFEPLGPSEAVLAAREGHPLAGATTWAELKDAKWVMNLSPGSLGRSLLAWLGEQGLPPPRHMIRCASTMLMLELMQRTDCIGIGPARLFEDRLVGHGIQCMHVTPLPPPMCFGILRLRGMPLSSAAKPMAKLFARYLAP